MLDASAAELERPITPDATLCAVPTSDAALDIRDREAAATIARLEARLAEQAMALAHSAKIFERASALARIGVWECSLPDEALTWTGGVYDLFDIPRGTPIDRAQTLKSYSEESRLILDALRSQAIAERSGFQFDAEIITATGRRRWMRLTATVECEGDVPVRIFGMKQDITDEKILSDRMRYLAEFDVMTGLPNRSVFQSRLAAFDAGGGGTLLLVDLDGFKQINDTFGHALGDDCLKDASARLRAVCAEADLVARIGGDEFAVVLSASVDARACEILAETIVAALKWPVERGGRRLVLGASVGIARADACSASELFTRADTALYAAKAAGRNTFRMFVVPAQPAASGGSWQSDRDGLRRGTGPQTFHRIEPAPRLGSE